MAGKKREQGGWEKFLGLMNSMKLAVILLLILTIISIIGVLLPQFVPDGFRGTLDDLYIHKYGKLLGGLLVVLDFNQIFTAWWYYILLTLVCVQITFCSFDRLGKILVLVRKVSFLNEPQKFREQANSDSFETESDPSLATERLSAAIHKKGYKVFSENEDGRRLVFGRRGSLSQFGPFFSHIGMVLIIVGAALSYLQSFSHTQWMARGDVVEVPNLDYMANPSYQFELVVNRLSRAFGAEPRPSVRMVVDNMIRSSDWRDLPDEINHEISFRVRLDRFEAKFTPEGKPKAYLSDVTVFDNADLTKPAFSHLIKVNDPLIHKGVFFYQSSYAPSSSGAEWVEIAFNGIDSLSAGIDRTIRLDIGGDPVALNATDTVQVLRFVGSFKLGNDGQVVDQGMGADNPAAQVLIRRGGDELLQKWVFKNFPQFTHGGDNPYSITMGQFQEGFITGLTIRTHKSQSVIWLGFGLMVFGIILSFYINHRQVWAMVAPKAEGGAKVYLAGMAFKLKVPFRDQFREIFEAARDKINKS